MREALKSGTTIAVVGWRDSNHNPFTRGLSEKKVVFYDQHPHSIGDRVGLVVFTRFVDHSTVERIGKKTPVCPGVFDTGKLKTVLESCNDLLAEPVRATPEEERTPVEAAALPAEPEMDEKVLDFLTTPSRRNEMTKMHTFAKKFMELAAASDGMVGKYALGKAARDSGIEVPSSVLGKQGWLEPVISEGCKNAGRYRASDKLKALLSAPCQEPDDPYARAKFIIAQEPALQAELAALDAQIEAIRVKMERINTAKKVLEQLNALESL